MFQCYRPQAWQLYLFFPALSISGIHQVLNLRVGMSRDPLLQKAYSESADVNVTSSVVKTWNTSRNKVRKISNH